MSEFHSKILKNYKKFSYWTEKNIGKLLFLVFFIEWSVTTIKWISQNPLLDIYGILFYYISLAFIVAILYWATHSLPYMFYKNKIKIDASLKEDQQIKNQLSVDSRNLDLFSTISIFILSMMIEFSEFESTSFYFVLYYAAMFFIIIMFIYTLISNPTKKLVMIFIPFIIILLVWYAIISFLPFTQLYYLISPIALILLVIIVGISIIILIIKIYLKKNLLKK
ncbi:MAG: hypothetical protein ACFFAH_11195 [Promethearchaeota archaeon]